MDERQIFHYFDYNATTPVLDDVVAAMTATMKLFANASSNNRYSVINKNVLQNSRNSVAKLLGTESEKIFFTSGGSEANNWAIKGVLSQHLSTPGHIITTSIEHASVLETVKYCSELFGFDVTFLNPRKDGAIRLDDFLNALRPDTQLVSVMYANNETGVIQPIEQIAKITRDKNIKFHVDGVQVVGKRKTNVEQLDVDLLSFSGHKFYGPKGIGGLYIKDVNSISPLIHGGGQEMSMRSGTENMVAIVGLATAAEKCAATVEQWASYYWDCKQYMIELLDASGIDCKFNGTTAYDRAITNTLNIMIPNVRGEALAALMERKHGFIISIGSACSNNKTKKLSHVLQAMNISETDIQSSIRVSFGILTRRKDIDNFVRSLEACVEKLTAISAGV